MNVNNSMRPKSFEGESYVQKTKVKENVFHHEDRDF